ncbi:glycosyltransferase family 2 protein [Thioalkalivibrio sp. ALE23]|uniref:glycosyltransferase family 2 protein n=1 Tax=Thioalkalivibrio sp. ALE23 TaxID=1265495 RepID=UPI00047684F5|nr:glycosyltransferase family 2 protein [Thioalkalivibrio sp. ALE23]
MEPLYSLIIPHFNDPSRLERLLRTVPVERADIDVIVVDDCSPEQEPLDAVRTRWPRVRWLSTRTNAGAGAARNVGLRAAVGRWLVFADSDDEFLPDAFEVFDRVLKTDDELVYFLADAVQEVDGSHSNRADRMNALCMGYLERPSNATLERLRLGHVNPVAKVYSRQFVERLGVAYEETWVSNDVAFNVTSALQASSVRVAPERVYRVFRRGGGLTTAEDPDTLLERTRVLARLNAELASLGVAARMHAGGYLYRAFLQGPRTFFRVFREVASSGLLWPTLRRLTLTEVTCFVRRFAQDRRERARL